MTCKEIQGRMADVAAELIPATAEEKHHLAGCDDCAGKLEELRQTMALLYQPTPDGMCGDEDTGQMSAWYVFSALGFYPVCPGTTDYLIGSPLFDRATLSLPNGKTFAITARNNGSQHPYIHSASLDGKPFAKVSLSHDDITRGGEIVFEMVSAPDIKWATGPESRPPSALLLTGGASQSGQSGQLLHR